MPDVVLVVGSKSDVAAAKPALEVLERYCRRARALEAERTHLVATSAVRDASNRDELP